MADDKIGQLLKDHQVITSRCIYVSGLWVSSTPKESSTILSYL